MVKKKNDREALIPVKLPLEDKRNKLIAELKPKLLSKGQLVRGGKGITERLTLESAYQANIDEINELGKQLGCGIVRLSDLRS